MLGTARDSDTAIEPLCSLCECCPSYGGCYHWPTQINENEKLLEKEWCAVSIFACGKWALKAGLLAAVPVMETVEVSGLCDSVVGSKLEA
jgi:hypothetical protein